MSVRATQEMRHSPPELQEVPVRRPALVARASTLATGSLLAIADRDMFAALPDGHADGVVTGFGRLSGRSALLWAQDPDHRGGSLGRGGGELIVRTIESAERSRLPVIGLVASGGARIQEGTAALDAYARIFHAQALATVPQISIICGICAGGGAYSPALGDFVITVAQARMFLTGPRVLLHAIGEHVSADELVVPRVHARNGVAHLAAADLTDAGALARRLLAHVPPAAGESNPRSRPRPPRDGPADAVLPPLARQVYDIRALVARLVDGGELLELAPRWAANLVVGFARLDGWPIGVLANQPRFLGGTLDVHACDKGSWFVDLCDRFGLPLAVVVDTPGFLPGTGQERGGVIRRAHPSSARLRARAFRAPPSP
jgi:acetyl-CoA carboxylase carboxyltransferase component